MDVYMKHSFTKLCTALAILIACCLTTDIYAQTAVADTATAITSEVITATETTVEEGSVDDTVSQLVSGVNTVWMLLAAMLVFFMQPGFALVEAGFTRTKNTANILMKNFVDFIFGSLLYWFVGFGIMFGLGDFFGTPHFMSLLFDSNGLPDPTSLPTEGFLVFQTEFCATSATIVSGAMAERTRFSMYLVYTIFISVLIYPVSGHWTWGGGWLMNSEAGSFMMKTFGTTFHDFAGSTIVHSVGGWIALVGAAILGPRIGKYGKDGQSKAIPGHNLTIAALGVFILWFGWFGFNAGSALGANGLAAHAFLTSAIASASAMMSWMLIDVIKDGKPTLVGASTGLVVGLVAITPGAGFVPIWSAFIIGALVSPICCGMITLLKKKLKIDDALDAFGCHGIGGVWGGIATGLFGKSSINSVARWDGLFFGDYHLFVAQLIGIVVTIAVAVVGTFICLGLVRLITPLRVSDKEEKIGLDLAEQGESAYPTFNGLDS